MPGPTGFLTTPRQTPARRPVPVRLRDWREVQHGLSGPELERQAGRCMDCGVPFCHGGCPLRNLIPEWNDLVWQQDWREAAERLHATNNFPEFTGWLCPAPCEAACVLGINSDPVTIKQVELQIIDRAWASGWVTPRPPTAAAAARGQPVAVIGSGPAGLAAAQQLTRAGHRVTVFEQDDRPGGLLRYGIPDFKMEKWRLDRRLEQLAAEGTEFSCGVRAGTDITAGQLRDRYGAIVLAGGAMVPRRLEVPGAGLAGIHQAMEYLTAGNRAVAALAGRRSRPAWSAAAAARSARPAISARGRHVVIIGGGDTAADCLGTALRQRPASVLQFDIRPRPPGERPQDQPWPTYPVIFRVSGAHEEGGERHFGMFTLGFVADEAGRVRALRVADADHAGGQRRPREGTEREIRCDLVLLALGFSGADGGALLDDLGISLDGDGNVARDDSYATSVPGVYVAGDMGRGQSLIVWAIAEGRSAAAAADRYLAGDTTLPFPIPASARPLSLRG